MKILKPFILLVGFYIVFARCSKSNESPPRCFLSSSTSSAVSMTYSYSNNKLSTTTQIDGSNTSVNSFKYDSRGRLISQSVIYNGSALDTFKYSYDTHGRLAEVLNPGGAAKNVYTYNEHDQVVNIGYYYQNSNSQFELGDYELYTYSDSTTQNYSSYIAYDSDNNLLATTTILWDNKKNPYSLIYHSTIEPLNNMVQLNYQLTGSAPVQNSFSYTYNDKGYPLTRTATSSGQTLETITYTYTNCK